MHDRARTLAIELAINASQPFKIVGIVAIKNRRSMRCICHHSSGSLVLLDDITTSPRHQWYRVLTADGFYAFENVQTGLIMFNNDNGTVTTHAGRNNIKDEHQGQEIPVGNGYVALKNRDK